MKIRWGWIIGFTVVMAIAMVVGEEKKQAQPPEVVRESPPPAGVLVTREAFGERWPFTVERGYAACFRGAAVFRAEGKAYALTGRAAALGFDPIDPIWLPNPDVPGTRISLFPVLNLALEECVE